MEILWSFEEFLVLTLALGTLIELLQPTTKHLDPVCAWRRVCARQQIGGEALAAALGTWITRNRTVNHHLLCADGAFARQRRGGRGAGGGARRGAWQWGLRRLRRSEPRVGVPQSGGAAVRALLRGAPPHGRPHLQGKHSSNCHQTSSRLSLRNMHCTTQNCDSARAAVRALLRGPPPRGRPHLQGAPVSLCLRLALPSSVS